MSERSKQVRCRVEHKKIKFISTSRHVIFCLLHKHTNDDVFDDFPKISDHFPGEHFRTFSDIFRRLPKIVKDFRGGTDDDKYFIRDYVTKAMVIISVTMATPISSHVKDKNSMFTACDEDIIF